MQVELSKLQDKEQLSSLKEQLSDEELKNVVGGFVVSDTHGNSIDVTPDYIIQNINDGQFDMIKGLMFVHAFTNGRGIPGTFDAIVEDFKAAKKQIPAEILELMEWNNYTY